MASFDLIITDFINNAARKGFKWGENDCALFANDMLHNVFNWPDIGAKFRGKYTSWEGALKALRECGYKNTVDIANKELVACNRPKTGDVALYEDERCLGVVVNGYSYFLSNVVPIIRVPNREVLKFWTRGICQQQHQS
jgi:hypothetical protein